MRVLTYNELMRLTRIELCDLAARITNRLPDFPEGSLAFANARRNSLHSLTSEGNEAPRIRLESVSWTQSKITGATSGTALLASLTEPRRSRNSGCRLSA